MSEFFYREVFEQMLKDSADRFTMTPSRRVWHSLYNDIHPSRKWPSSASFLFFVLWILFFSLPEYKNEAIYSVQKKNSRPIMADNQQMQENNQSGTALIDKKLKTNESRIKQAAYSIAKIKYRLNEEADKTADKREFNYNGDDLKIDSKKTFNTTNETKKKNATINISLQNLYSNMKQQHPQQINENSIETDNVQKKSEEGAFAYQIYATPSLAFRDVSKNMAIMPNSLPQSNESKLTDNHILKYPELNIEAGGSLFFNYSEIMRFKAGVQFNYSRYNLDLTEENEQNMFMRSDLYSKPQQTDDGNFLLTNNENYKKQNLNNKRYQVSLPLGADLKLAGDADISWYAGATVQPTLILMGNDPMLATEIESNYEESNLMRKWNINGGIETFVSYRITNRITINAGPQFRYQILSSYRNAYMYNERLYNFGVKMGISSRF